MVDSCFKYKRVRPRVISLKSRHIHLVKSPFQKVTAVLISKLIIFPRGIPNFKIHSDETVFVTPKK